MAQTKIPHDTNSYLRLAQNLHPLLFVPYGEENITLYAHKDLKYECMRQPRLAHKFDWILLPKYEENRKRALALFACRRALCREFCLEAFPDTKAREWEFRAAHGPASRNWVAMDLFHRSCAIHFGDGYSSEEFTPFVRVTNSYDASRAVRLDVGFMRGMCSNGMIYSEDAAKILASHTEVGIRQLKMSHPFEGMAVLVKQFGETISDVRAVAVTADEGADIARRVIGWPTLADKATPRQRADQLRLDEDLDSRRNRYFRDLGANAYAAFNIITDFASHPSVSPRIRRDRPALERMAGAWLRRFRIAAKQPGFTVAKHIKELVGDPPPITHTVGSKPWR